MRLTLLVLLAPVVGCDRRTPEPSPPTGVRGLPEPIGTGNPPITLKPTITADEADAMWQGRRVLGQGCGVATDATGRRCGYFVSCYKVPIDGRSGLHWGQFHFYQPPTELFEFDGPGFRYVRQDGQFVSVPPKPGQE
jgi:hypothetical protein